MQSKSLDRSDEGVSVEENGRFLRNVLRANAIFSTVNGLFVLFFAENVAQVIGLDNPVILVGLGLVLLPFAFFVYKVSAMVAINTKLVWVILELDILWVVGSAILLFTSIILLTTMGKWGVGFIAEVVAVFAILEYVGLRKLRR